LMMDQRFLINRMKIGRIFKIRQIVNSFYFENIISVGEYIKSNANK